MNSKFAAIAAVAVLIAAGGAALFIISDKNDDSKERAMLDDTLDVFGNANGDWTIDQDDISLIEKIIDTGSSDDESDDIDWQKDYPFADADHDGEITQADINQTEALINGTAAYVNMNDGIGGFKHIGCNPGRIAVDQIQICEYISIMGQKDKVVCGDYPASILGNSFYFDQKIESYGSNSSPDYEKLESMDVDLYLTFYTSAYEEKATKLVNTDVVYLGLYLTDTLNLEKSSFVKAFLKGGYIFNDEDRSKEYVSWLLETRDKIKAISDRIDEDEKKNILITNYGSSYFSFPDTMNNVTVYADGDTLGQASILAGAKLAAESFSDYGKGNLSFKTDAEWLGLQDIDYIFMHSVRLQGNGKTIEYVPDQGYTVDNWAQFREVQEDVSKLKYVQMAGADPENVYLLAGDFRNNASSGLLLAAHLVKILYPEECSDFDPYEIHQEYMEWMGKGDYDITSHGTFIVPPYAEY